MLKPTLQLRLGQQLTMTPQLQQAIRLLQLPALDLQAHIREALESNVMLESLDEVPETATGSFEATATDNPQQTAEVRETQPAAEVEITDDSWAEQSTGPSETPWSGDEDRAQEFSDQRAQTLQEHLAWQLELARLEPRDHAIGRAVVDAINDDGYLTDSLEEIRHSLLPELDCDVVEVERVLGQVQGLDPAGVGARSIGECISLQLQQLDPQTPGLDLALRIAESISMSSPPNSTLCSSASCTSATKNWKMRWRWCAPAIRVRAQRFTLVPRSTSCPTYSCVAPRPDGRWRSTRRRCLASA